MFEAMMIPMDCGRNVGERSSWSGLPSRGSQAAMVVWRSLGMCDLTARAHAGLSQ
jgi:hypothetical protein